MRQQQPFHINTPPRSSNVARRSAVGVPESHVLIANTSRLHQPLVRLFVSILLLAVLSGLTGCNSFGNSRLLKELQSENDRLLLEFRGQRDRAAELEKTNQLQAARLAESEKLLARLSQGGGAGRLSSLPHVGLSTPVVGLPAIGPAGSNLGSSLTAPPSLPSSAAPGELRWQPRARGE